MTPGSFTERFNAYFEREVAQNAAKSISNGAEMEFQVTVADGERVTREVFTFTRKDGRNQVIEGPARDPQLLFMVPSASAEAILADPSEEIGTIGVNIIRRVMVSEPEHRISVHFRAGFLNLFMKGYFGVLSAGGGQVASYLASKGLNGMGAIKSALKGFK